MSNKNTDRLPGYIIDDIREQCPFGVKEWTDEDINAMSNDELFNRYLNWNGIMGYAATIKEVFCEIYKGELIK